MANQFRTNDLGERTIRIKHIEAGQPRPYADSNWKARISCEMTFNEVTMPARIHLASVLELTRQYVHTFNDLVPSQLPYLKECYSDDGGLNWYVTVHQPYTD